MRYRVPLEDKARAQLRDLAPVPRREVRRVLRAMEDEPFGPDTIKLRLNEIRYRVRVGNYRIVFRPGPGEREVTVTRIGRRESVYEGLERESEQSG